MKLFQLAIIVTFGTAIVVSAALYAAMMSRIKVPADLCSQNFSKHAQSSRYHSMSLKSYYGKSNRSGSSRPREIIIHDKKIIYDLPFDWSVKNVQDRSTRLIIQSLIDFYRPLLQGFAAADAHVEASQSDAVLIAAKRERQYFYQELTALVADWIDWHHININDTDDLAWNDMAVCRRILLFIDLLQHGCRLNLMKASDRTKITTSLHEHAEMLNDLLEWRLPKGNHAVFIEIAAWLVVTTFPNLSTISAQRTESKLLQSISEIADCENGITREHSSEYHLVSISLLEKVLEIGFSSYAECHKKFVNNAQWFMSAPNRTAAIGDTMRQSFGNAVELFSGFAPFVSSGYAFQRHLPSQSYMAFFSGYWTPSHKQCDDLSIILLEGGKELLSDAGGYSYNENQFERRYARSSWAHNVLITNEIPLQTLLTKVKPFGNGLVAASMRNGDGNTWSATLGVNFSELHLQACSILRLVLYKPNISLVVLDVVSWSGNISKPQEYKRIWHLGPEVKLHKDVYIHTHAWEVDVASCMCMVSDSWREIHFQQHAYFGEQNNSKAHGLHFPSYGKKEQHHVLEEEISSLSKGLVLLTTISAHSTVRTSRMALQGAWVRQNAATASFSSTRNINDLQKHFAIDVLFPDSTSQVILGSIDIGSEIILSQSSHYNVSQWCD